MIRTGEDALDAEGIFDISEDKNESSNDLGYEIEDDELIITRYFDRNSKAKIAMNGNRLTGVKTEGSDGEYTGFSRTTRSSIYIKQKIFIWIC